MKFIISLIVMALTLAGCSSHSPTYIKLNPQIANINQHQINGIPLAITTIDKRKANFIVQFDNKDDPARLISPAESPRKQLAHLFKQAFRTAGYQPSAQAPQQLEIQLDTLLTRVDENLFNYQANTSIIINIIATNGKQTLTKRYNAKGKQTGAMSVNLETLEQELNQLLSQVSLDIINDAELNQFLIHGLETVDLTSDNLASTTKA